MSRFLYWPYDEVSLTCKADENVAQLTSPWLKAKVNFQESDRPKIETLADKFAQQSVKAEDLPLINWFFGELDHYPFCYIVPVPKDEATDQHSILDQTFTNAGFGELLTKTVHSSPSELSEEESRQILAKLDRKDWSWDAEAAISFAQLHGKIHPESLFSVVRRFHLLDVSERDEGKEKFAFIENLQGEAFARAASLLVRQNHYVTQRCQDSLLPALNTAQNARHLVESFVKEENGHDRILGVAMKALTPNPDSVPVSIQTKAIMHLLKFAASRNFLAFAMAVDFFERSSYEDQDPLAALLIKGGFEKAAKQINRHMEINDAGGHENVACSFLESMAAVDADYAQEAVRIAEMISVLMNTITSSAVDLYENESITK